MGILSKILKLFWRCRLVGRLLSLAIYFQTRTNVKESKYANGINTKRVMRGFINFFFRK